MAQSFFSHYADGRVKGVHLSEGGSAANSYDYDQKGRLQEGNHYLNYAQNYDYDAWDNLTSRTGSYHGTDHSSFSATYLNNRNTAWGYDQAGNMISDGQRQYSHDVANRTTFVSGLNTSQMSQIYDGDGQAVKVTKNGAVSYYVRSSVIGQIITELNALGSRKVRYVYANGRLLAELIPQVNLPDEIFWVHENPVTSERLVTAGCGIGVRQMSFDALGNAVENNNYANTCQSSEPDPSQELMETSWDAMYGDSSNTATGCYVDGFETSCSTAANIVNNGAGVPCPDNYCGPRSVVYQGQRTWAYFNAYGDGYSGYIPSSARYTGNGNFVPRGSGGPSSLRTNTINDTNFADLNGATDEAMLGFPQDTGQQAKYGNLEKCQRTYLAEQYPEGKPQPTDLAIGLALDGGLNDTGDSAMILALWAKESSFDPRPRNDHGPMQLTSWWSNYSNRNNFNLIVPGAYDSFGRPEGSPNRDRRFQGKISANVMTAGNIIRHSRTALGQSYYQIGYGYGPGPDKATRNDYATHASRLQSRYANFINCLKTGQ